eukprot:m.126293 g.126293  ORF g.126293 m.126293 type:complete len:465 (-) comp13828_c0_seq2:1513-2907(-)
MSTSKHAAALLAHLRARIKISGPLSVADYMREAILNPASGYYVSKQNTVGEQGDFITSPEVSPVFSEMLGVWSVMRWQQHGQPNSINLIELGPGTGNLMATVAETIARLTAQQAPDINITLVEASPLLVKQQGERLGCSANDFGFDPETTDLSTKAPFLSSKGKLAATGATPHVQWMRHFDDVPVPPDPENTFSCIFAHEFFDALPVHQFRLTKDGWREQLVALNDPETDDEVQGSNDSANCNKDEIATQGTGDADVVQQQTSADQSGDEKKAPSPALDFPLRLTLAPEPTAFSKAISNLPLFLNTKKEGDVVEVSYDSVAIASKIGKYLTQCKNADALIVDYGEEAHRGDTLRAFRDNKQVHVFDAPGTADITADVDFNCLLFGALRVARSLHVNGPVEQRHFLQRLGIEQRFAKLMANSNISAEDLGLLRRQLDFLTSPTAMGSRFKVINFSTISDATHGFM